MGSANVNEILETVAIASRQLTEACTEDDASTILCDHLARLGCPDSLISFVREHQGRRFVVGVHATGRLTRIRDLTLRAYEGPAGSVDILSMVVRRAESVFIADSAVDSRFDNFAAREAGIVSQYIVPLKSGDSPFGALQVGAESRQVLPDWVRVAVDVLATIYSTVVVRIRHRSQFDTLREQVARLASGDRPPEHSDRAADVGLLPRREPLDHLALVSLLKQIPTGTASAHAYHLQILELLQVIFNPYLCKPRTEQEIHDGRKRIDIVFNNGRLGFFGDLVDLHRIQCPYIFVECRNYALDPKNPELDQLAGRFSEKRGRFGILVCRRIRDRQRLIQKCRDALNDDRGYILAIDDSDIQQLLTIRGAADEDALNSYLDELFRQLVM